MFGVQQRLARDPRLENRRWAPLYHTRRRAFSGRAPPLHDQRAPPVTADHDPINTTISRLSLETVKELERVAEVGALQRDDVKQSVRNILDLLRAVSREQFRRTGAGGVEPRKSMIMPTPFPERDVQLNNSIMSIALDARNSLQNLATNASIAEKRSILEGLRLIRNCDADVRCVGVLHSYRRLLESEVRLNSVHITTMLHRTVSLSTRIGQHTWVLQKHDDFIGSLLRKVCFGVCQEHRDRALDSGRKASGPDESGELCNHAVVSG